MKQHLLLVLCSFAITVFIKAQNCNNYLLLQNNKKIEMTIYSKKGKENGKQVWNISNYKTAGAVTTATVNTEMFNDKGKSINKGTSEIQCSNGALLMNMKLMLTEEQLKQMGESAATAKGTFIEYPASVKADDILKDGRLTIDYTMGGNMNATLDLEVTGRKVTGKETVSSPAGTWECFTITSTQKLTTRIAGMGIPVKLNVTEWYAPGTGVVKTESKWGSTLITSIQ